MDNTNTNIKKIATVTKVLEGVTYPRVFSFESGKKIVWMTQVTQLLDGDHHFRFGMNLSTMEISEVYIHAAKNTNIDIRPRAFKNKKGAQVAEMSLVINPFDYPAERGGGINKREASIRSYLAVGFSQSDAEFAADNPEAARKALNGRIELRKNSENGKNGKDPKWEEGKHNQDNKK